MKISTAGVFLIILAAERGLELLISRRNEIRLKKLGGVEYGAAFTRLLHFFSLALAPLVCRGGNDEKSRPSITPCCADPLLLVFARRTLLVHLQPRATLEHENYRPSRSKSRSLRSIPLLKAPKLLGGPGRDLRLSSLFWMLDHFPFIRLREYLGSK
jgi:hypothetical protein